MRRRLTAALGPAPALALALGLVLAAGCAGPGGAGGAGGAGATPAPPAPRPPSAAGPLEDCVLSIGPWLQASLDGTADPGDYQEMGLSSAQGGALRELQRRAGALRAQGPLPAHWAAVEVRRACETIAAARATLTTAATGWP
ncbi:hypothetical protein ACFVVX_11975 [Kitasatospora sp. NPDC058170]|uniref:hypothetical protein n=1 Tax=Kitasatospora sp. NPDC058170 TaxID=3346364 RepID=UPI0036D8E29C